jgi:23S rRNA pseudouridine1911/1915/1917 synthase
VHMSHIGHGLIGDPIYGTRRKVKLAGLDQEDADVISGFGRQALHAARLGFVHPISGENVVFESELPDDLKTLEQSLKTVKAI